MAEEFQTGICGGNWWNVSKSHVFNTSEVGSYGSWLVTDVVDLKPRSCKLQDNSININTNNSVSHDSSVVFQDSHKSDSDSILMDSPLQMMGFGISSSSSSPSSSSDWSQAFVRGNGRGESYNTMLQEDMNSSQIQKDWSPKSFTSTVEDSSVNVYKAINHQDFSLEQQRQLNPNLNTSYGYPLQSLFEPDHSQQHQSLFNDRSMNYTSPQNYGTILNQLSPSWPKLSPSLKPSLHFSNNTPFWNASATAINDIRPDFFPSSQPQFLVPTFEEKPNCHSLPPKANNEQIPDSGSVVKKGSEPAFKRPRIETPSPLPTFKVRKEKLGDRITALQQLVSPFGKTDTASVLQEAIDCIKFLHDQVNVLSTPYMKNGNPIQHQQGGEKLKEAGDQSKHDLKSRGLCLVPISSTYPVANETSADFWTPTFGGTYR